jgi:peptidoglycan/LPS O-acetylase OafA/YrhL
VFFVISGMLITRLLLVEHERDGGISLKNFYIRRTFRIVPAMWAYVAVITCLSVSGIIAVPRRDILHALTYIVNYFQEGRSWYLLHMWSLSVEEQFYLLWPLVLCLGGPRTGRRVALFAIGLEPLLRILALLMLPGAAEGHSQWFPTASDAIATGCMLPLLAASERRRLTEPWIHSRWFFVVPVSVVGLNWLYHRAQNGASMILIDSLGVTLMNFGIAFIVERVVAFPNDRLGLVLNSGPVVWMGRISYSLYLWQMPFLNHQDFAWITRLPINVIATFAAATVSYYFVETPFLNLRKHLGWGEHAPGGPTSEIRVMPLSPTTEGKVPSGYSPFIR